jgi:hypothetical protein
VIFSADTPAFTAALSKAIRSPEVSKNPELEVLVLLVLKQNCDVATLALAPGAQPKGLHVILPHPQPLLDSRTPVLQTNP